MVWVLGFWACGLGFWEHSIREVAIVTIVVIPVHLIILICRLRKGFRSAFLQGLLRLLGSDP